MNPIKHKLAADQQLFSVGDPQNSFYFVISGVISLFQNRDGRVVETGRAAANAIVDEIAYFSPRHRTVNAKAVTESELLEFRFDEISSGMKTLPPWVTIMMRHLGERAKAYRPPSEESQHQIIDEVLRAVMIARVALTSLPAGKSGSHTWEKVKEYALQILNIPPTRLEPVIRRLHELNWLQVSLAGAEIADLVATTEGLQRIHKLEEFIRRYRHSNHAQILEATEIDEILLGGLVQAALSSELPNHHSGAVSVPFEKALASAQALGGGDKIRADHFEFLLSRGIDLQKQSTETGVVISFQLAEGKEVLENWKFLRAFTKRKT